MKSFFYLSFLVLLCSNATAADTPFELYPLGTHQPIGNNEGQTNYYHIFFTVTSLNDGENSTAYCETSWSDNTWVDTTAYSVYVPTGSWIACDNTAFSFQLFPYFAIGNFSIAIQQNCTMETDEGLPYYHIMNGTSQVTNTSSAYDYDCEIVTSEVKYVQHANGNCSIPDNGTAITVEVSSSQIVTPTVCAANATVGVTFIVESDTTSDEGILLVGSIPELGDWAPSSALLMTGTQDSDASLPTYSAVVNIPAGTSFEYKYLLQNSNGSETWECCENRYGSVAAGTCGSAYVSIDPDYFRGGGYPVET